MVKPIEEQNQRVVDIAKQICFNGALYAPYVLHKFNNIFLYDQLIIKKPIIGIAKTNFYGIPSEYKIYRGTSKHPLYVTCIDISIDTAKTWVQKLQGQYRIPDIVKKPDILSRKTDTEQ